jgi:predicted nucleotidyltransferase
METLLSSDRKALTRDAVCGILMSYYHSVCGESEAQRFEQSVLPKMEQVLGGNPHSLLRYGRDHIDMLGEVKPRELIDRMEQLSCELHRLAGTPVASTAEVCEIIARALRSVADQRGPYGRMNVAAVVLYGSYARGQQHAVSDLDLCVIFEDDSGKYGCELVERAIRSGFVAQRYSPPLNRLVDVLDGASLARDGASLAVRLETEFLLQSGYLVIARDKTIHDRLLRCGVDARKLSVLE